MVDRSYQLGWWPQGGKLDTLDTALSLPILLLDLGKVRGPHLEAMANSMVYG